MSRQDSHIPINILLLEDSEQEVEFVLSKWKSQVLPNSKTGYFKRRFSGSLETFQPDIRFHTHVEGKGMSRYGVKAQVEAPGYKIGAQSEVNKGTEFKMELPL